LSSLDDAVSAVAKRWSQSDLFWET